MNKKIAQVISIILILIICLHTLSGCYDAESVEALAYAVAIGIDKGENDKIKLSLQIAIPNSTSGQEGSSQSEESSLNSVDCSSIDAGIALINTYISEKINLSHCKAIVISEEIAYEGISEYLYTLVNNLELRPDCNIIISKCKAYDYLDNSDQSLEKLSAKYYEFTFNSSEYTGYTQNITLSNFYSTILSTTSHAYAILRRN